ncbi:hypothetical protein QK388_02130 [Pseudomonas aeruginosa]|nr:hypothetical protein [Pseudomonas aeruginosa]MDI4006037.1 hypothetical protein [Pseudomonas aeruginosa]
MAAQIPQYRRRVGPDVPQAPRALGQSVDASGLAQGINSAVNAFVQVQRQEIEDANRTAVLEADNGLGAWENDTLFNPESGAFTKKGRGALNITQSTLESFDKQREQISSNLANESQREMFNQAALRRREGLQAKLGQYEFREQQVYKDEVDKSSIQLAMDTAALNYNDPKAVEESRSRIDGILQLQAQRNGWGPEVLEARRQKVGSEMYADVLQRQAAEDPYRAQKTLKEVQGSLTADDLVRVGGMIESKIDRLQQKAEMAALRRENAAQQTLNKINAQIASGVPASDEMWKEWSRSVQGTSAQKDFQELVSQEVETQKVLNGMPIDQQAMYVNQKAAELQKNGGTLAEANNLARLGRAIAASSKMLGEAPLEYFQTRLGGEVQPIDLSSDDLPGVLSQRITAIRSLQDKFGQTVSMKPLLPQEAKQLSAQVEGMSPQQQSELFGKLHTAMGDDRAYAGAMQQIAPDSPIRALTGMLAGKQRSLVTETKWFRPDVEVTSGDVARTMATGESILNKTRAQKQADGASTKYPIPPEKEFVVELDKQLGGVFAGQPQSYGLALQAVKAYYTGAAAEQGIASADVDSDLMKKAIKASIGSVVDFNGQKTIAPWGMSGSDFEPAARASIEQLLDEQGASDLDKAMIDNYTLRQARDGVYYVMQGQQFKYGTDGKPLIIKVGGQ